MACIEAILPQVTRAEPIRTMVARPMVTKCIRYNRNTLATSMPTILLTLRPFPCDGPRSSSPPPSLRRSARRMEGASLYFCRDQTLRLSYRLFIIATQLYIFPPPQKLSSANRPPPPRHPFPCIKIPYYGLSLFSCSMGFCILSKDRRSLNATPINYISSTKKSLRFCCPVGSPFPYPYRRPRF